MNIDYNAVMEILKKFLENEKTEILGISVGEERQVRDAIRNLLTAYENLKSWNKGTKEALRSAEELERQANKEAGDWEARCFELEAELEKEKEKNKILLQCLKDSQERCENEHLFLGNPDM